jgi:endonuclease/exonuclease/phosphatase family metal-dependent hydrolase
MSIKISVLTFNSRVVSETDGVNIFYNRKQRIMDTINDCDPDLIGFQEVNDEMREWLKDSLSSKYETAGCGRNKDYKGECVLIAYKKNTFEAISSETFWLSSSPTLPGSNFAGTDQSRCPRICTVVDLKHVNATEVFSFYNTHLDHKGAVARLLGAVQIMQRISMSDKKFIITGDMNAKPQTPEINVFTSQIGGRQIKDLTEDIGSTYHGFGKAKESVKIDYIFTDLEADKGECVKIEDNSVDGIYISDHNPVMAKITLE